jgi:hypothetical protein
MNLDDEENRLALQEWVAEFRCIAFTYQVAFPKDPVEALARLEAESEMHRPAVERAVSLFATRRIWPAVLSPKELFYIHLRVLNACRIVEGILSGEVERPDIVAMVVGDKLNFTEWMLVEAWNIFGQVYLESYANAQAAL